MAAGVRRSLGEACEARLRAEVGWWQLSHSGWAVVVRPDEHVIAAEGRVKMDIGRATDTYQAAYA
jgi:hypothetical protein